MFKREFLGIDISENRIRILDKNRNIVYNNSLFDFPKYHEISQMDVSLWENTKALKDVIEYFLPKQRRLLRGMNILLAIPAEFINNKEPIFALVGESDMIHSLIVTENIISAAIGATSEKAKILGPNEVTKKLYVFSQKNSTYFALIWAGGLVDFRKSRNGFEELNEIIIIDEVSHLLESLSADVPEEFLKLNEMKPYFKHWFEKVDTIYISIPEQKRYSLGNEIGDFKAVYTNYSESLVIDGLKEIDIREIKFTR